MQNDLKNFLPNLFVLGAAKCGTTSLYDYLNRMPEVCMSNPKEPFFFECEFEKGLDYYQKTYFSHYNNQSWIGEARHRNMYLPYVPERINSINPDARLIFILRNPVDRSFSHWWHAHSRKFDPLNFKNAIREDLKRIEKGLNLSTSEEIRNYCSIQDNVKYYRTYVDSGYYMQQIERYLEYFSREQILILFTKDLYKSPEETIEAIRKFLNLPTANQDEFSAIHSNKMKKREAGESAHKLVRVLQIDHLLPTSMKRWIYDFYNRNVLRTKKIDKRSKRLLLEHYKPHNDALQAFTGRNLSHWNNA